MPATVTATDELRPLQTGDDQQTGDKEAKAVFLPEERASRRSWQTKVGSWFKIKNEYVRITLAEFIGTFVLVSIGCGSVAQAVLSNGNDGSAITIYLGWGIAVMLGVYASGGVSGGHINPAVTTAMVLLGRVPVRKLPCYIFGQYMGAIFGSLLVWIVYLDFMNHCDSGVRQTRPDEIKAFRRDVECSPFTAHIWPTYPQPFVTTAECMADQLFSTGLLVLVIMAITDERNMGAPKGMVPLMIGLAVAGIVMSFGTNCGGALNPARDLGPRLFTAMAGWGAEPFTFRGGNWFWVPILGPHFGAIFGALFYNICVGLHWPKEGGSKKI